MKKFLVDSDVIIWYLKGREQEYKLLKEISSKGELFMSVISITEVRTGLQKNAVEIIDSLTDIFHPVSVDENIAAMAGALKQKYNLAIADMIIAASTISIDAVLVTYNKKHFPMPELIKYNY